MLCFLNDATGLFITLPNVTRLSCYNLQPLFEQQLASQLAEMGISQEQVDDYLQQGGQWQINKPISRKQVIYLNRNINALKKMQGKLPPEFALQMIGQSVNYDANKTYSYFQKLPAWQEPEKHMDHTTIDQMELRNTFQQICYITQHREKSLANADSRIEGQFHKLQRLNNVMITAFIAAKCGELGDETLARHQERLDLYFNEYLAGRYLTFLHSVALHLEAALDHGYSLDEILQIKTAMQEFYRFLLEQNLINNREWLNINNNLSDELQNSKA